MYISQRGFNIIVGTISIVIAAFHILRLIFQWPVRIGYLQVIIPYWASLIALVIFIIIAYTAFRLNKK